jgi:CHAD domain-containing protein
MMAATEARRAAPGAVHARDLLAEQISAALRAASRKGSLPDEAIHGARKSIKRARAGLRVLRDAVGEQVYVRGNARLRDAARPLSRARDSKILLEALGELLEHDDERSHRALLSRLRSDLRAERLRVRRELHRSGTLEHVRHALAGILHEARRWRVEGGGRSALRKGVERTYRKGRKAFREARDDPADEKLHESRKQVKYLGQGLEMFASARSRRIAKAAARANAIAGELGDDHDLAVLQQRLGALRARDRGHRNAIVRDVTRQREKLQRKALKRMRKLYRKKPKVFSRRFEEALASAA